MKLDKKFFAGILSELPASVNLPDYLADSVAKAQETAESLVRLHAEMKAEEDRYKESVRHLQREVREVQEGCRHWSQTRYDDPNGGMDHYTQCDLCGLRM